MSFTKLLTKREKRTWQYYEKEAEDFVAMRNGLNYFWKPEIERFYNLLPDGKILEIGSGAGLEAALLIQYGYEYTGTDISVNLLEIAKKANPKGTFVQQSVYELDLPSKPFDGFWSCATLLHIPKIRIHEALSKIHSVIKPGGIGFISLCKGNTEEIEEITGRFFASYQLNEFRKILFESQFNVLEESILDVKTRDKNASSDKWLIYFVKA